MPSIFGQFIFEHFPSYIICFLFRQHFWALKNRNLLFCSDGDFLMLHWTHFLQKKPLTDLPEHLGHIFPRRKFYGDAIVQWIPLRFVRTANEHNQLIRLNAVWQNLAKFTTLAKLYKSLCKFLSVDLIFGKVLRLLRQICYITGLIFIVANGQILKHNRTIWSHWLNDTFWANNDVTYP